MVSHNIFSIHHHTQERPIELSSRGGCLEPPPAYVEGHKLPSYEEAIAIARQQSGIDNPAMDPENNEGVYEVVRESQLESQQMSQHP